MQSEFAAAIDPVFEYTIELLQKLESGSTTDPIAEHAYLLSLIHRVDLFLGNDTQWKLAKYAIASWIDEMLLSLPWDGASWWENHILEMELFQTRLCHIRFFELAKEATSIDTRDALEVFYNCVILGFRGIYSNGDSARITREKQNLPSTIEQWLDTTLQMIDLSSFEPLDAGLHRAIEGAPPFNGSTRLIWWSVAAMLLAIANGATYILQTSR